MGIRVSVVAGEPAYRAALIAVINSAGDMECVNAQAATETGLEEVMAAKPDIVLIVPTASQVGSKLIGQVRAKIPDTPAIVLDDWREGQDILRALSAGAVGYLLKSSSFSAICEAIRQTFRGGSALSPEIAPVVLRMLQVLADSEEEETISEREQQILDLLRVPARNKEIAVALNVSVPTVRTHLRTIYVKLRVRSRSEAIQKLQTQPPASPA